MAGGADRRAGQDGPVLDRLGLRVPAAPESAPAALPDGGAHRQEWPTLKHVWVADAPEVPGRWPGILMGWARDDRGWLGRVSLAAEGREGIVTMTLWVRAEHLVPLDQ